MKKKHALYPLGSLALACLVGVTTVTWDVYADSSDECIVSPPVGVGTMVAYPIGQPTPGCQMAPAGSPEQLGAVVLQGNPTLGIRLEPKKVDSSSGAPLQTAGIFQVKTSGGPLKVQITFPFSEHATIIVGQVTITDESGNSRVYGPGDSYFIRAGSVVLWEQNSAILQKSFYDVFQ